MGGSLFAKACQKNVWKMFGSFFCIFWTFFQRQPQHQDTFQTLFGHFSGKLPGSPKRHFGASWQLPRKMSKKCLESVLVLGLALEKCPENVKKVSPRYFPDTFFHTFWQIERW